MLPRILVVLLHLIIVGVYAVVFLDESTVVRLGAEDGVVESLGAAAFLLASVFFAIAYARSRGDGNDFLVLKTRRNLFLLLLALLFFFAGAEEISWGQRIFGWATPESLAEVNTQGETTLHNLEVFQKQPFFHPHFIFSLFWLSYCVLVPLVDRLPPARALFRRVGLPIPPFWIGSALLIGYVTFKLVAGTTPAGSELRDALNEFKETNSAVVFTALAYFESRCQRQRAERDATAV